VKSIPDGKRFFQAAKRQVPSFSAKFHPSVQSRSTFQLIYHLQEATSLASLCDAVLVLVAVPVRPGEKIYVAQQKSSPSGQTIQQALQSADSLEEKAQILRTATGLRVETAASGRDPEAFMERISGQGRGNLLVVATREQALEGAEKFLRHRNVPVLLLANW
jgi:hypothetical protein